MQGKNIKDSITKQAHIVMSPDVNGYGRLFGGRLIEWMDVVAGVTARRHCGKEVTTACIDGISFLAPAHCNDIVEVVGKVVCTGRTSMEVNVRVYAEDDGEKALINTAHFVMVAIGKDEKPSEVPPLLIDPDDEESLKENREAAERSRARKERRKKYL
ncbi:MAG: acyl-CoA thioesterase [Huintestinicola sp.]